MDDLQADVVAQTAIMMMMMTTVTMIPATDTANDALPSFLA